ncbi:MAG: hypothetical protein LUG96_04895 [Tannerellaceae bacterium]|nr:hypothetical protein [Bacillota bacterium]MCD7914645.1 hypothetical protein [Tannerellaceae bacterium]
MASKKVKVLPDGPYQVTGNVALDQLRYITDHKEHSVDYDRLKKISGTGNLFSLSLRA